MPPKHAARPSDPLLSAKTEPPLTIRLGGVGLVLRSAALVYDALLLLALWLFIGLVFVLFTEATGVPIPAWLLFTVMLLIAAAFYHYFGTRLGQTLGMQAWRLQLRTFDGRHPPAWNVTLRFMVASAQWIALFALIGVARHQGGWVASGITAAVVLWIGASQFHPRRWMLHDYLSGTELVRVERQAKPRQR